MSNAEEKELAELHANVRALVKGKAGRDILWYVIDLCQIYSPVATEFVAGKRSVGLDILELLQDADPTLYANLILQRQKDDN